MGRTIRVPDMGYGSAPAATGRARSYRRIGGFGVMFSAQEVAAFDANEQANALAAEAERLQALGKIATHDTEPEPTIELEIKATESDNQTGVLVGA